MILSQFFTHLDLKVQFWLELVSTVFVIIQVGIAMLIDRIVPTPMSFPTCALKSITKVADSQGRNKGNKGGGQITMWAMNHKSLQKVPTMSQVLSPVQCICFRMTLGSNRGMSNLFLATGPIYPCSTPADSLAFTICRQSLVSSANSGYCALEFGTFTCIKHREGLHCKCQPQHAQPIYQWKSIY